MPSEKGVRGEEERGAGGLRGGRVARVQVAVAQGSLRWVQVGVASSGRDGEAAQVVVWQGVARGVEVRRLT